MSVLLLLLDETPSTKVMQQVTVTLITQLSFA